MELPFECPLDFLLPADSLEAAGVDYRHPGFLALPQVPDTLRRAKAAVVIVSERPATPFPQPSHTVGHAVTVWAGIRQGELVQAVAPVEGEAVLQLRCAWGVPRWCLVHRLPACLHPSHAACLPACRPACLPTCLPTLPAAFPLTLPA